MTDMPKLANAACREPAAARLFELRPGYGTQAQAKAVCATCWDRPECLAWGLEHEDSGVWGGHGPKGLRDLRQRFGIEFYPIYATGISEQTKGWRQ